MDEKTQKELQQKYMEVNYMQQHLEQYKQQLEMLDTQVTEIDTIIEGLETINKTKKGSEILIPVSNGIFAKAKLTETDSLIVNVGSNVAVEKDVAGTKDLLARQKQEIENARIQITNIIHTVTEQMKQIEQDMNQVLKEK